MRIFEKQYFWLVLKLEISCRVIIKLEGFGFFFKRIFSTLYFCVVKYLSFHNSSIITVKDICVYIHYRVYDSLRDFWPLGK